MTGTTLSAVDRIPVFVLTQVANELDLPHTWTLPPFGPFIVGENAPCTNTIQWAMQGLGIDAYNEHHQRALLRAFRPPVANTSDSRAMAVDIMSWLFTRGIRIPGPRRIQTMALKVVRIKSLFVLHYVDKIDLRQAIEQQLSRIELAHRFNPGRHRRQSPRVRSYRQGE